MENLIDKITTKLNETKELVNELREKFEENSNVPGTFEPEPTPVNTGKCYLTLTNSKAILNQKMFVKENVIYVLSYNFTLTENIKLPNGSSLFFDGGSVKGPYVIDGNGAGINEYVTHNIFNDTKFINFSLSYIDLRWVGGVPDYNENKKTGTDNYIYFKRAIDLIGEYYNGLYIKLVGKYYIGKTIETEYDLNIVGSHCASRYSTTSSSPSMIAIGDVTAFLMNGRSPGGKKDWRIAHIFLKNLKLVGHSTSSSTLIEYRAHGCPTRISTIEECEFTGLKCGLFVNISKETNYPYDTSLGNLSIYKCQAYDCNQFIKGYSSTKLNNNWVGNTFNNLSIRDCNIEQNGARAIELGTRNNNGIYGTVFGNIVIDNNNLEGQETPISIVCGNATVTISNNYFEATLGTYVMDIHCTNQNSRAVLMNNYYAVSNNKVRLSNFTKKHIFDNASVV